MDVTPIIEQKRRLARRLFHHILYFVLKIIGGIGLYFERHGLVLAGAISFYAILAFLPLLILLVASLGMVMDNFDWAKQEVLVLIVDNFPGLPQHILKSLEHHLLSNLVELRKGAGLHWGFLVLSTLALFKSVLNSINLLSQERRFRGLKMHLAGVIGIVTTIVFLFVLTLTVPLLAFLYKLVQNSGFVSDLLSLLPSSGIFSGLALKFQSYSLPKFSFRTDLIQGTISLVFVYVVYRLIFWKKLVRRDTLCGALSFTILFIIGKSFYWVYILYARNRLMSSYGPLYTIVASVLWVYFLMGSFLFGASVALASGKRPYDYWTRKERNKTTPEKG